MMELAESKIFKDFFSDPTCFNLKGFQADSICTMFCTLQDSAKHALQMHCSEKGLGLLMG